MYMYTHVHAYVHLYMYNCTCLMYMCTALHVHVDRIQCTFVIITIGWGFRSIGIKDRQSAETDIRQFGTVLTNATVLAKTAEWSG